LKREELIADPKLGQRIFNALGPEHATLIVLSQLRSNLTILQQGEGGSTDLPDPTFLSNKLIAKALNLSRDQQQQIHEKVQLARDELTLIGGGPTTGQARLRSDRISGALV